MGTDVKTKVVRVAAQTAGGDQTITGAGFTPKSARFTMSRAITDGVAADDLVISKGFTDGTTQFVITTDDENAVAFTASGRRISSDEVIQVHPPGDTTIDAEANFKAWTSDGVTITWGVAPPAAYLITVEFFGGVDYQVDAGLVNDVDGGSSAVTGLGFQPDTVTVCGVDLAALDTHGGNHAIGIGWSDGTTIGGLRARSSSGNGVNNYNSDFWNTHIPSPADLPDEDGVTVTIDADGFTLTEHGAVFAGAYFAWIAESFGDLSFWVGFVDTPTSIGEASITGPNFKPQFARAIVSTHDTLNVPGTDGTGASWGFAAIDASAAFFTALSSQDNVDSNTQSLSNDQAIVLPDHTGTAMLEADFVAFIDTGLTLDWTDVDATARKSFWFFLEAPPAGGPSMVILRRRMEGY